MRRLLVFTENYARGGGNRYLVDLVNSVADEFDSVVIASNRGGIFPEDMERLRRPAETRRVGFLTKARAARALGALPEGARRMLLLPLLLLEPALFLYNIMLAAFHLLSVRPGAVICCNGGYPGGRSVLAMTVAARIMGVPAALSVVSTPMPRKAFSALYESAVDRLVWRSAGAVIVNARTIAERLEGERGLPAGMARIVHNGIEAKPSGKRPGRSGGFTIGCVARTDRAKGVVHLMEAFISFAGRHPEARLRLAGSGDAAGELERMAAASGLGERIELLGFYRGPLDELLESLDVYVFPSLQEGFPYSILEAMRSGRTIVATRVGGIPEAITDGAEGVLIEPASSKAIEEALERLIADGGLRRRLADSARRRFEAEFTLEAMEESVRGALREAGILGGGRRAAGRRQERQGRA